VFLKVGGIAPPPDGQGGEKTKGAIEGQKHIKVAKMLNH